MVTADHGLAGARYAESYSELHHVHLDLRDVQTFTGCDGIVFFFSFIMMIFNMAVVIED